jgi:hypothetical protein
MERTGAQGLLHKEAIGYLKFFGRLGKVSFTLLKAM